MVSDPCWRGADAYSSPCRRLLGKFLTTLRNKTLSLVLITHDISLIIHSEVGPRQYVQASRDQPWIEYTTYLMSSWPRCSLGGRRRCTTNSDLQMPVVDMSLKQQIRLRYKDDENAWNKQTFHEVQIAILHLCLLILTFYPTNIVDGPCTCLFIT